MGINGIAANYYQAGYTNNQVTKAEAGKSFVGIASQKVMEAGKETVQEKTSAVLGVIGANAPDEVRQAWLEASEETGSNGFSITSDGKHFHIPKLLVQHAIRWYNGEIAPDNILGNFVESAIRVAEKVLYDIDHPLPGHFIRIFQKR